MAASDLAFAFRDGYPVSRGHTLGVTRRVFSATADDRTATRALELVKKQLGEELLTWRKRMGIEPTMPLLAQSIIGFEDRGRHQSGTRFQA